MGITANFKFDSSDYSVEGIIKMNDVCKDCGHHWLSHVIIGPNGNGCQELVGDYEYESCGCETFVPSNPVIGQNTSAGFRCPGHCFGLSTCPYAVLIMKEGQVVACECHIPKQIGYNVWLMT